MVKMTPWMVLEANLKLPTKHARREMYLPPPTVWLCLYQTCLWKTEGI